MDEIQLTFESVTIRCPDGIERPAWALYRNGVLFGTGTDQTSLLAASERQRMAMDPSRAKDFHWRTTGHDRSPTNKYGETSVDRRKKNIARAKARRAALQEKGGDTF